MNHLTHLKNQVRAALCSLIYRKALVLARVKGGAGEVINLVSSDVTRIVEALTNFHFLWSALFEALAILIIVIVEIRESAVPAIVLVILLLPVQYYLGKMTSNIQQENTAVTTERVHLMSEVLTAVKLIKFYAWEVPFSSRISEIRLKEVRLAYRSMFVKSVNFAVVFAIPVLCSMFCLLMYAKLGNPITATLVFTILSVLNTLRYPFLMLPMAVKSTAGARISINRVKEFLLLNEIEPVVRKPAPESDPDCVFEIKNGQFTWEGDDKPTLEEINLKLKRGQVLAVIGDVGSGKSSLVAALLGQIKQTGGDMKMYASTSYVPQEAWLLNCSLRDNILFGSKYESSRYKEVIHVCALERDLTLLIAGDQTEIGERGSNLSGGQRQRSSLARAVYSDQDIILLDDPLSAVDQNVGRHIFEKCIKGFLQEKGNKAVVLVTHQLQYLQQCDYVCMVKNGRVEKFGVYDELYSKDEEFKQMMDNHVASGEEGDEVDDPTAKVEVPAVEVEKAVAAATSPVDVKVSSPVDDAIEMKKLNQSTVRSINDIAAANSLSVQDRSQLTVRSVKFLEQMNDKTISSIVERNQLSVVAGGDNTHDISKIIARNENTIHSMVEATGMRRDSSSDDDLDDDKVGKVAAPKLVKDDTSADRIGAINYKQYFQAGHGTMITTGIIVFFFVVHGVRIGSDYWLRLWIPNSLNITESKDEFYLGLYGLFVAIFTVGVLFRGIFYSKEAASKTTELHDNMFTRIMRAPQSFFDTTPMARILSAFAKHQFQVDETMPDAAMQALQYIPLAIGAMLLIAIIVLWNWGPVIFLTIIGIALVWWSSPAEKKLKQLEAITKPPVYGHLATSIEGLFSIRAYNAQKRFDDMNLARLDTNHEALFGMLITKSWIAFNIDVLTSLMIYFTALFIVLFREDYDQASLGSTAGLALSNALQLLVFLQWSVRMLGDVQGQISSVGQLHYYGSEAVAQEAPAVIPDNRPAESWPHEGTIEFKDIVLRYQKPFGVPVLKKVSFKISPREKVGIVGRTGSGKSTLLVSLLRIVEADEGSITIDGMDVSKIGLKDLRTKVAIIPQEPVLFVGTIRTNLDPFNLSTDEEIWKALEQVHLADRIRSLSLKLEAPVIENGKNYSLGQRQLFCICRAILSKTQILVLDEASSSLDLHTDNLIQETIKKCFADLTVLTIAHRLNTIIEADKVLLMEGGVLQEFDEPIKLLRNPESEFAKLVAHTGEAATRKLVEMAEAASKEREAKRAAKSG